MFDAAGDAGEVYQDDAVVVGFYEGDQAAVGDFEFCPAARFLGPAVCFDVQDLQPVEEEGA